MSETPGGFCSNCGSPASGAFCSSCGAALSQAVATVPPDHRATVPPPVAITQGKTSYRWAWVAGVFVVTPLATALAMIFWPLLLWAISDPMIASAHTFNSQKMSVSRGSTRGQGDPKESKVSRYL